MPRWLTGVRPGAGVHVLLSDFDVAMKRWRRTGHPSSARSEKVHSSKGSPTPQS